MRATAIVRTKSSGSTRLVPASFVPRPTLITRDLAEIKAFRFAVSHRDETIKLTREATDAPADDPRPGYVFDEGVKPGVVAPDFPIPIDSFNWMNDQLVALGQIPKTDVAKMIDPEIRVRALERIGK